MQKNSERYFSRHMYFAKLRMSCFRGHLQSTCVFWNILRVFEQMTSFWFCVYFLSKCFFFHKFTFRSLKIIALWLIFLSGNVLTFCWFWNFNHLNKSDTNCSSCTLYEFFCLYYWSQQILLTLCTLYIHLATVLA